jgi:hypothetical protein
MRTTGLAFAQAPQWGTSDALRCSGRRRTNGGLTKVNQKAPSGRAHTISRSGDVLACYRSTAVDGRRATTNATGFLLPGLVAPPGPVDTLCRRPPTVLFREGRSQTQRPQDSVVKERTQEQRCSACTFVALAPLRCSLFLYGSLYEIVCIFVKMHDSKGRVEICSPVEDNGRQWETVCYTL